MNTYHNLINRIYVLFGRNKKYITPKELRESRGKLTETNATSYDLEKGAERQYRKHYCKVFQHQELSKKLGTQIDNDIDCSCNYCSNI